MANSPKSNKIGLIIACVFLLLIIVLAAVFFITGNKNTAENNTVAINNSISVSEISENTDTSSEQTSNSTDSTSEDTTSPVSDTISDTATDTEEFVTLPLFEGESIEQVKLKLDELGLEYTVTEQYHDTVESGKVISQMPEDGTRVTNDNVISIYVSKGKDPDKKEESSAENDDTDNSTKTSDNENPNNTVSENTEQPVLSNKVTVPKIVGTNAQDAMNTLTSLNLYYTGDYAYDDNVPQGQVISQSPQEGTEVEKNSRVNFVISNGKQPEPQEQQIITYEYTVPAEDNTAQNSNTATVQNWRDIPFREYIIGTWRSTETWYLPFRPDQLVGNGRTPVSKSYSSITFYSDNTYIRKYENSTDEYGTYIVNNDFIYFNQISSYNRAFLTDDGELMTQLGNGRGGVVYKKD